jgi:hypothetical protein
MIHDLNEVNDSQEQTRDLLGYTVLDNIPQLLDVDATPFHRRIMIMKDFGRKISIVFVILLSLAVVCVAADLDKPKCLAEGFQVLNLC